ncbi:HAD family hydrolase [Bifidobacterium choloepi]|uniref:HAD hydrolase family protein n=1 Tax=Bifidobacterium choloepi TaxID=2614131 RepID=A0A6I5NJT9_9BIFI|nr:HAD family hydrolase [Bifidobacterium choloepi]NEG69132.1 HAD hydrolase family protein [Bifidobacterium choloepi]
MTVVPDSPLVFADLDGTLLHDAEVFEDRFLSNKSIEAVDRLHDKKVPFVVATARPVSTGLEFARKLRADAVIYLNGALIDWDPAHSTFETLTGQKKPTSDLGERAMTVIGFSSKRACELCLDLLSAVPDLHLAIVMSDVRYANFNIGKIWATQTWTPTDFRDVPAGTADKVIAFPTPEQARQLAGLIPSDFDVHISEGWMWMIMNPLANKEHATELIADRWNVDIANAVSFGDDLIDINMMKLTGTGVAVANANPEVLKIADDICPANDEDGVATWLSENML